MTAPEPIFYTRAELRALSDLALDQWCDSFIKWQLDGHVFNADPPPRSPREPPQTKTEMK